MSELEAIKVPHTFCIFANDTRKMYHIWQTSQENYKQNVTVTNAFSKAAYALSGKDSAQSGSTTTFLRILSSTKKDEWTVSYEELGDVDKEDLQSEYQLFSEIYESEGYTCITRDPKVRMQTGRYAGKKWVARKLENMRYVQVKECVTKMLEDCLLDDVDYNSVSNQISTYALKLGSEIENISQLWNYVFHNYSEFGDNVAQ
jgi:hypothetical protein